MLSAANVQRALPPRSTHRDLLLPWAAFSARLEPDLSSMSQSSSSMKRMLDSPFSHKDVYGTSHPLEARRKGRRRRVRKNSSSRKHSTSSDSSSTIRKGYRKKGKTDGVDSTIACLTGSSASRLSLPRVDHDSPKLKAKQQSASAVRSQVNPSISASAVVSNPHVSAISSCNGRSFPSDSNLLLKFSPLQGHVIKPSLGVDLARGLSTSMLGSGDGKTLPIARGWWTQRVGSQRRGGHSQCLTLEELARGLAKRQYQKIVVMSGAGISTASGIPDFRYGGDGDSDEHARAA